MVLLLLRSSIVRFGVILWGARCGVRMENNSPRVVEVINMISGYNLHLVASCDSLMSSLDMDTHTQPLIFNLSFLTLISRLP